MLKFCFSRTINIIPIKSVNIRICTTIVHYHGIAAHVPHVAVAPVLFTHFTRKLTVTLWVYINMGVPFPVSKNEGKFFLNSFFKGFKMKCFGVVEGQNLIYEWDCLFTCVLGSSNIYIIFRAKMQLTLLSLQPP